VKKIF